MCIAKVRTHSNVVKLWVKLAKENKDSVLPIISKGAAVITIENEDELKILIQSAMKFGDLATGDETTVALRRAIMAIGMRLSGAMQVDEKIGKKVDFDSELIHIKTPSGSVSDEGVRLIYELCKEYSYPNPSRDFEMVWMSTRGTLPKRLANYYYKNCSIKVDLKFLEAVGNIAKSNSEEGVEYHVDFTRNFGWSAGDFGDPGSCFWRTNAGAKEMIQEHSGFAIRTWSEERTGSDFNVTDNKKKYYGQGRAWVIPMNYNAEHLQYSAAMSVEMADGFLLFNGYGVDSLRMARLFSIHLGCTYRKVANLTNNGDAYGTLYLNGGMGFLIGPMSFVGNVREGLKIDLDWTDVNR